MTGRLPFDPKKIRDWDTGGAARREKMRGNIVDKRGAMTVTEVSELLKDVLAVHTPLGMRIVGEISNFRDRKHWYLTLKDEENSIDCVMWSSKARGVGFVPEQGMEVVATGRLDFYGPSGKLQLYVDKLEPVGKGELEIRFRQLCKELRGLGYFSDEHKLRLPGFAERVAVVTSRSGAALHDVVRTARQRWCGCEVMLVDALMQGEAAAGAIAGAIRALSKHHERLGIDVVILTRGGGSMEDLWAFNEREVADAIFEAEVPIVAAIGHETDTTIAELVADVRCSTPTQAAMRVVSDAGVERVHLSQLEHRLGVGLGRGVELRDRGIEAIAERLRGCVVGRVFEGRRWLGGCEVVVGRVEPRGRVAVGRQSVAEMRRRLNVGVEEVLRRGRERMYGMERELGAIGPIHVLRRGYTYTMNGEGGVVRSADELGVGERMVTHFVDGEVASEVVSDDNGGGDVSRKKVFKKKKKKEKEKKDKGGRDGNAEGGKNGGKVSGQMGLFGG